MAYYLKDVGVFYLITEDFFNFPPLVLPHIFCSYFGFFSKGQLSKLFFQFFLLKALSAPILLFFSIFFPVR
nr:MAG TPA: hypothetical protein [Caudoviricetes sp.]